MGSNESAHTRWQHHVTSLLHVEVFFSFWTHFYIKQQKHISQRKAVKPIVIVYNTAGVNLSDPHQSAVLYK